jgi:hypothetical protein
MGLAKQLGLVDQSGWPTQAGGRTTTVRGVVAGATEKVPLMNLTYELQGEHRQLHSSGSLLVGSFYQVLGLPEVCLRLQA